MSHPKPKTLLKLKQIPAILRDLTGVTRSRITVYNWVRAGRINAHGQRIKLRVYRRLGQIYTTEEDVIKFLKDLG